MKVGDGRNLRSGAEEGVDRVAERSFKVGGDRRRELVRVGRSGGENHIAAGDKRFDGGELERVKVRAQDLHFDATVAEIDAAQERDVMGHDGPRCDRLAAKDDSKTRGHWKLDPPGDCGALDPMATPNEENFNDYKRAERKALELLAAMKTATPKKVDIELALLVAIFELHKGSVPADKIAAIVQGHLKQLVPFYGEKHPVAG